MCLLKKKKLRKKEKKKITPKLPPPKNLQSSASISKPLVNPEQRVEERKYYDRFDNLDNIAHGDQGADRVGAGRANFIPPPISSSWYSKNVGLPQRMALLTMACIIAYEVLVFASMGVQKLRWMMNNWLMWVMLSLNIAMMMILAAFVFIRRRDADQVYSERVKDVATGRGKEKQEFTV